MNYCDEIAVLKNFNQKAERLNEIRFTEWFQNNELSVSLIREVVDESYGAASAELSAPDLESIEAFVLTFRFFIQDGDGISFRRLAAMYQNFPVSQKIRDDFDQARSELNELLDRSSMVPAPAPEPRHLSYREVKDVVMYGALAHINEVNKSRFDRLAQNPHSSALLTYAFAHTLREAFRIINKVKEINEQVLSILTGLPDVSSR